MERRHPLRTRTDDVDCRIREMYREATFQRDEGNSVKDARSWE